MCFVNVLINAQIMMLYLLAWIPCSLTVFKEHTSMSFFSVLQLYSEIYFSSYSFIPSSLFLSSSILIRNMVNKYKSQGDNLFPLFYYLLIFFFLQKHMLHHHNVNNKVTLIIHLAAPWKGYIEGGESLKDKLMRSLSVCFSMFLHTSHLQAL